MVVKLLVEKFKTSTAPRNAKPFTVAVGTAAYTVGSAVGTEMLEVAPGRWIPFPMEVCLLVSTAKTLFEFESKVAAIFRVGETTIRPGEFPAFSGETRGRVSFWPLTTTSEPNTSVAVTP